LVAASIIDVQRITAMRRGLWDLQSGRVYIGAICDLVDKHKHLLAKCGWLICQLNARPGRADSHDFSASVQTRYWHWPARLAKAGASPP